MTVLPLAQENHSYHSIKENKQRSVLNLQQTPETAASSRLGQRTLTKNLHKLHLQYEWKERVCDQKINETACVSAWKVQAGDKPIKQPPEAEKVEHVCSG